MTTVKKTQSKATSKTAAKKAQPLKVDTIKKKETAKKTAVAKKAEPVKKAAAKKVEPVKKVVAKKAEPVKKVVAKKAELVKKVVAKKAEPVKKAVAKKAEPAKKTVVKKESPEKKGVSRPAPKQPESTLGRIKIQPISVDAQTTGPVSITHERPKNVGIDPSGKRRLVVSYSNMKEDVAAAFKEKYPRGYSDYMGDLFKVDKPDGTSFYAITLETETAIYLIKMVVTIDRAEDAQKTLFPDSEGSDDMPTEGETFPDDNTENMSDSDDDLD